MKPYFFKEYFGTHAYRTSTSVRREAYVELSKKVKAGMEPLGRWDRLLKWVDEHFLQCR